MIVEKTLWTLDSFAYLRDAVEHDSKEKVSAVGLLGSLSFVLEEGELALDVIPEGHLVDIVEEHEGIKRQNEVLHTVNGRQEYFL